MTRPAVLSLYFLCSSKWELNLLMYSLKIVAVKIEMTAPGDFNREIPPNPHSKREQHNARFV